MGRLRVVALLVLSALWSFPPAAANTTQLALPTQPPESTPPRPVGDPEVPPIGLDFFFEPDTGHEEAWPWPPSPTDN